MANVSKFSLHQSFSVHYKYTKIGRFRPILSILLMHRVNIQSAVSAVEDWSREHCMQLNADKCKEMIIDFKNNKHVFSPVVVDEKELTVIIVPNF